jgi:hypothetical protein
MGFVVFIYVQVDIFIIRNSRLPIRLSDGIERLNLLFQVSIGRKTASFLCYPPHG